MSGSSTGQILGYVVGAVVGYFTGGAGFYPTLAAMGMGASVGGAIGGAIDPPKGPLLVGPRLNDLSVQTATYGAVIPRVYGTVALMGNIFWLENNKIKEKKKTESQGKGGGGGTQTKTYSYYGTFAVGLCEGPIAGVRRIWVGSKLIYDAGSNDLPSIIASNESATLFTVYNGADDQMPDDRMQATLGVANTPAFRGLAYIVIKDYPLKDHGNSLLGAQVKVEVIRPAIAAATIRIVSREVVSGYPQKYYPSIVQSEDSGVAHVYAYDPYSGVALVSGEYVANDEKILVVASDGRFVGYGNVFDGAIRPRFISSGATTWLSGQLNGVDIWISEFIVSVAIGTAGRNLIPMGSLSGKDTVNVVGSLGDLAAYLPSESGRYVHGFALAKDGSMAMIVTRNASSVDYKYFYLDSDFQVVKSGQVLGTNEFGLGSLDEFSRKTSLEIDPYRGWISTRSAFGVDVKHFYIDDNGDMIVVSMSSISGFSGTLNSTAVIAGNSLFYVLVRTSINAELIVVARSPEATAQPDTLSAIVSAESLGSGILSAGDIDVLDLTQQVRGYRVSSVAAIRSGIEPLQGAWPFDVLQAGYQIKFKPRGSAVVATIPAIDLDAQESGKGGGVSITSSREMDSILPQRVVLRHIDVNREYDQGEQYAERLNTTAVNIQTVEMPIVMTGGEAAANAEMLLYLYWLERHDVSFSLPPTYGLLEPGDVLTVNAASATYELRLTSINYLPDGRLECSAKFNSAAVYSPTALGEEGQSTGAVLTLEGGTSFELLDIPLLLDATDTPGFPVAMTGYLAGWPGGILYRTDDSGQTWTDLESFVAPGCIMGSAGAAIGAGRTDLIDKASALTVSLTSGELSSITEAAMFGGANHFAYGAHGRWEIIAAQNCMLQGDGGYILTDLLRGRFGSEHACASHTTGDSIVLLDSSRLAFVTANLNTIGASRTYRGVTAGKDISTGGEKTMAYTGVNLECLSPIYLNGNRHPSTSDWALSWIRRTRVGGEWRDYVDAPLGEASEVYEVEIYSSAAYTTLKRTLTGLATPAASYTSAQQVADFGSNQATLYVKVYQLSANVGRGYPLTTRITR